MNWLDLMNAALDYIEENLNIRMNYEIVAAKAGCSSYNFQRMFSFITGVSLAAYVRRRCITLAAQELAQSDISVIDVALKYGYDSPTSFARAFHSIQEMAPFEAKKEGAGLKLYPKITFQISIKGDEPMKYHIEKMQGFKLAGVSREITTVNGENFKLVPKMWEDICSDGTCERISNMNGHEKEEMYGVCYDFHFSEEKFRYMVAVKPEGKIPKEYEELNIPSATWVKFESKGAKGIQDIFKRVYTEWFPTSGYEHAGGPEIEWYSTDDKDSPDYRCEVWFPITPLKK
ncbi:MAG TPA: GyrI-like domain-containing protein [Mobilitalea sp.]|nr:GyrI-like domain-containing protein [Mobilitalea sp.]